MDTSVCIIGGGASGLTAAICAAARGASVLILEKNEKLGKKILATGNGRCNLTNTLANVDKAADDAYRGSAPNDAFEILRHHPCEEVTAFFELLGVRLTDKGGYIYPASMQAQTIADALIWECARLKVQVSLGTTVTGIKRNKDHYVILTNKGSFKAPQVILACGGMSQPKLGSDGSGFELAASLGHHISKPMPALCALKGHAPGLKLMAGVRAAAAVTLYTENKRITSDQGEVQMTDYGISGIPVFQISRYAAKSLLQRKETMVSVDFAKDDSQERLLKHLLLQREKRGD